MTESNLNLSQGSDDMPLSAPNIEQALDILTAEAANLSDRQNQKTALANVNLLRDLISQTRVAPMSMTAPMRNTQGNSNAERAIAVAKQVQDLGFVEFTAGLINGTFDAIIGATLKQMKAYAELVADLAKTLSQFQAENISDAQVNAHLSNRYPDGIGGTSVRSNYTFQATAADPANGVTARTANDNLQAVVDALILETAVLPAATRLTRAPESLDIPQGNTSIITFTATQIARIRTAIGQTLASNMMDHLRAMAREGMARIVITDGSIRTKLTFNVTSTEVQATQKAKYNSQSFGASIRGSAGWGWGRVSASASYSNFSVNTVNESSFDSLTMSTEMIGEVHLKFKTETFPAIVTQGG
jgi:hypothetical protein